MKNFIRSNPRAIFYATWLLLGLLQAGLTELQDDEAYYWVYSRFLDWGYFDHPPMTALLVKMGYAIFPNELGVRLFPLLLNVLSLRIIEKLIAGHDRQGSPRLFYAIALSMAVIQLSGFVAVPDIPLIFFTALFFLCYRRLTEKPSLLNSLWLGLSVALLLYSKYHAVLIVFFTLLSNPKLLTRYHIYLAGILSLVLFSPHLWWQYDHDWVSFRYHLFESNVNRYKPDHTLGYVAGQLLLPGPFAGFVLLPATFLYRTRDRAERALKFTTVGIYLFFLLSSFRGEVEGNWTSPALVGVMVLSHQYLATHEGWRRWLWRLLPVTLVVVIMARVVMIVDLLPLKAVRMRYHAWHEWPAQMREKTKGLPVVFSNSYQRASKYWFYSGQPTYSLNNYKERRNNFNFWPLEDSLLGKPVYFLDIYDLYKFSDSLQTPLGFVGYRYDSAFASFAKIQVSVSPLSFRVTEAQEIELRGRFLIPERYRSFLKQHAALKDTVRLAVYQGAKWKRDIFTILNLRELADKPETELRISPALPTGDYFLRFALNNGNYFPTHNSDKIGLKVR